MPRLSFALVLLVGLLAGGLGVSLLRPQPPQLGDTQLRALVVEMLQKDRAASPPAVAEIDATKIDKLIDDYLMADPTILQRMSDRLAEQKRLAERKAEKALLEDQRAQIYDAAGNVVLGNPHGDVTLVEMFDYNCTYCRSSLPDLATLMAEDPKLRVILKQFPLLTQGSLDAARIAVLIGQNPRINYWDFHQALFSNRGEVDASTALKIAEQLGGNRPELTLDMNSPAVNKVLQNTYILAKALGTNGTPTYILGDEMIPGAIDIDQFRSKIANLRACGSTECPASG